MESLNFGPIDIVSYLYAVLCGFIIGFERQWMGKTAGIRTSILICLGACIFTSIGHYYQPGEGTVRVVGQIATGIGFIGAGVIIAQEGLIKGVTSASVVWVLAALGCLTGLKHHLAALLIAVAVVIILITITYLENLISKLKSGVHKETYEE
jgi:putative Mg2+ transporter-C (MgtC) family protein